MATETSTVVKKILPHLNRLGYLVDQMEFEEAVRDDEEHVKGFIDIEIHHKGKPVFIIEAKRDQTRLGPKERQQVFSYAKGRAEIFFAVVTNGYDFQLFNARTGQRLKINGSILNGIPRRQDLDHVLQQLRKQPEAHNIVLTDRPPSYRPGLSEYELKRVFMRCHNRYRKHEGEDKEAFYDFSKIMFLKLLEEKADKEFEQPDGFKLPPGWERFDDLAAAQDPGMLADRIKTMFERIQNDKRYGKVIKGDSFQAQKDETYSDIVRELAKVSFEDTQGDVKDAKTIIRLRRQVGEAHRYSIDLGLSITVNGEALAPEPLTLLCSNELVPVNKIVELPATEDTAVTARIFAGLVPETRQPGSYAGWYIFCNGRLVLTADQTRITGWGESGAETIPKYHPQFARFRGYALLESANAALLPWNTSKTGVDENSPVYRHLLFELLKVMRPIITFLNRLDKEFELPEDDRPLNEAVKQAEKEGGVRLSDISESDTFLSPSVPPPQPAPKAGRILFYRPPEQIEEVKKTIKATSNRAVGEATFDYFYERECSD